MKVIIDPRLRLVDADGREGGLETAFAQMAQAHVRFDSTKTLLVVKTASPRRWQGRHMYHFASMIHDAGIVAKDTERPHMEFCKDLLSHLIGDVLIAYYPDDRSFVKHMTPVQRMAVMADGFSLADTSDYRPFASKSLQIWSNNQRKEYQSIVAKVKYAPSMRAKSKFPEYAAHMKAAKELDKLIAAAADYRKAEWAIRKANYCISRSDTLHQHISLPQLPDDEWIYKALCGLPRSPFATKGDLTELIAQRPNTKI